jgi:hypothetical protein
VAPSQRRRRTSQTTPPSATKKATTPTSSSRSSTVRSMGPPRSASRPQLPPVVSAGLRQRSMKAQGVAVGVVGQPAAHDNTTEPIKRTAIIKAIDVLMPVSPSRLPSGLLLQPVPRKAPLGLHLPTGIGPRPATPHQPHQEPHQGPAARTRCGIRPPTAHTSGPLVVMVWAGSIDRERAWQEMVAQIATDVEGRARQPLSPRGAVALTFPCRFALRAIRPGAAPRAVAGAR